MSSVLPFTYKIGTTTQCPFPGAYIFTGSMITASNGMVPIYTSMPSFAGTGLSEFLNNKDTQVLVLPGYSLQLYNDAAYGTLNTTADNSGGTDVLFRNASLAASSCKLFYKFRTGYAEIPSNL
jgi:hypothetical protein